MASKPLLIAGITLVLMQLCQFTLAFDICSFSFSACQNGGTCNPTGSPDCFCPPSFTGRNCENHILKDRLDDMNEQISTLSGAVDVGPPPTFTGDGRGMKSILDQAQTNITDVKESLLTNCDRAARAIRVHFEAQMEDLDVGVYDVLSCKGLRQLHSNLESGYYWIVGQAAELKLVYCEMRRHGGGWTRAFHFNVTSQGKCPGGFRPLVVQGVKMCTKGDENYVYERPGVHFSEVMGYVTGYKSGTPDAFWNKQSASGDSKYVDGVGIYAGHQRSPIYTLAAGFGVVEAAYTSAMCPCNGGHSPPSFVGTNYMCSGFRGIRGVYSVGPGRRLWLDAPTCEGGNHFSSNGEPRYFHVTLDKALSYQDRILLKILTDEGTGNEAIAVDSAEFYVR
eukprot:scpid75060/ scgid13379/ 